MLYILMLIMAALTVNAQLQPPYVYPVGTNSLSNPGPATNTDTQSFGSGPGGKNMVKSAQISPKPQPMPQVLSKELRTALSRITSKGFIVGQKELANGRKELTWTDGKNTVVTTQKIERVQGKKSADPRRAEIAAVKAERDAAKAERDSAKAERDAAKIERDAAKAENADLKAKKDKTVK